MAQKNRNRRQNRKGIHIPDCMYFNNLAWNNIFKKNRKKKIKPLKLSWLADCFPEVKRVNSILDYVKTDIESRSIKEISWRQELITPTIKCQYCELTLISRTRICSEHWGGEGLTAVVSMHDLNSRNDAAYVYKGRQCTPLLSTGFLYNM